MPKRQSKTSPRATKGDPAESVAYWLSRPPEERFAELERLRRKAYGVRACTAPMDKTVIEFALRPRRCALIPRRSSADGDRPAAFAQVQRVLGRRGLVLPAPRFSAHRFDDRQSSLFRLPAFLVEFVGVPAFE